MITAPQETWENPAAKATPVLRDYRALRDRPDLLEYQPLHLRHRAPRFVRQSVLAYARAHVVPPEQVYQDLTVSL